MGEEAGREQRSPALSLDGVSLKFAGVTALRDVSFDVQPGELFSMIGPNGAGKPSLFNCISGVYKPQHGRIALSGTDITGWRPHRVAKERVVRTFQNVEVFPTMTVVENLMLGRYNHLRSGLLRGALFVGPAVREEVANRARIEEIVELLEIEHLRHSLVGSLPHGVRKRVELGRALAMDPVLLLLDEPVAGMNQEEIKDMVRFVLDVHDELAMTIVLVEHDMGVVMDVSDRVAVLDFGQLIAVGTPAEVASNEAVVVSYLGAAGWPARYDFLAELDGCSVDEISIEAAQPRLDLNVLDELPSKRIQFGVLDLRDTEVEPVAMVRAAALVRRELADRAPVSARESASRARTTR